MNDWVTWVVLLVVVGGLAALGFWLFKSGNWARTLAFLSEVRSEMRKVSFPTRDEVVSTTIVVVVTSVVFAIYLWVADLIIQKGYMGLVQVLGS